MNVFSHKDVKMAGKMRKTWTYLGKFAAKQRHRQQQPAGGWVELTSGKMIFQEKEWDAAGK